MPSCLARFLLLAPVLELPELNRLLVVFRGIHPLLYGADRIFQILSERKALLTVNTPDGYPYPAIFIDRYFEFLHLHDRFPLFSGYVSR
jgi:hypothetical protein